MPVEPTTRIGGGEASIENDQVESAASGLPARSVTPPAPPLTVTVYVAPYVSAFCGVSVAVLVARVVRDGRRDDGVGRVLQLERSRT